MTACRATPVTDDAAIIDTAVRAARAAGEIARTAFVDARGQHMRSEYKAGFFDIVTVTDRACEAAARRIVHAGVPDSRILGEESGWSGEGAVAWFIDPIDGTSNFASGLPIFCVSIAAWSGSRPVCGAIYDPMRDEMFLAANGGATLNGSSLKAPAGAVDARAIELLTNSPHEGSAPGAEALAVFGDLLGTFRAVRRLGSCALHMAYVAAGRAGACYESGFHPWDIAAGLQLALGAGARIRLHDPDGGRLSPDAADITGIGRLSISAPGFDLEDSPLESLLVSGAL